MDFSIDPFGERRIWMSMFPYEVWGCSHCFSPSGEMKNESYLKKEKHPIAGVSGDSLSVNFVCGWNPLRPRKDCDHNFFLGGQFHQLLVSHFITSVFFWGVR